MNPAINRQLLSYVERLERLEADKKEIAADIRDVKTEAKSAGFDLKYIARVMALRRLTPEERRNERAMTEMYCAGVGILDGTPLGDAARDRMMAEDPNAPPPAPEPEPDSTRTAAEAREEGAQAHRDGARIIDNPYTAGDPRRAAWDEGFCAASGSDGMDIPEAWRRKPKGKANAKASATSATAPAEEAPEPATDPDQEALPFEPQEPAGAGGEAAPVSSEDADPATRLDALVRQTRSKASEAKAKPAKEPKAPKATKPKAPKAAAPRTKRRPAGSGEARP
ncbi:DUF2312 domain-containing protein [Xanthobacter flavus]|uniref:DUF2312 domain-containing protein n=1 Tax=Xanthobacter flavus TaxID=281 RepID=UPI00372B1EE2